MSTNVSKHSKNCHDKCQLARLLLVVKTAIIDKENITVNSQNRLIAHPY